MVNRRAVARKPERVVVQSSSATVAHRALAPARLDLSAGDRFGRAVQPREWFLLPVAAIDELVSKIGDGSTVDYRYDPDQAQFVRAIT